MHDRGALATGTLRALIGFIFLLTGTILLLPAVVDPQADFAGTETFALLVALGLEHLVGPDVRSVSDPRKSTEADASRSRSRRDELRP